MGYVTRGYSNQFCPAEGYHTRELIPLYLSYRQMCMVKPHPKFGDVYEFVDKTG